MDQDNANTIPFSGHHVIRTPCYQDTVIRTPCYQDTMLSGHCYQDTMLSGYCYQDTVLSGYYVIRTPPLLNSVLKKSMRLNLPDSREAR